MLRESHVKVIKEQYGAGKRIAFTAIGTSGTLGVAVEGESGYYPIPDYWHHDPDYNSLSNYANKLNLDILGLDPREASNIVITTMRGAVSPKAGVLHDTR